MSKAKRYQRLASLKSLDDFASYLSTLSIDIPFAKNIDLDASSPLGSHYRLDDDKTIGNRFCILPMEGWDGTHNGLPTDKTRRRWHNFGLSGAKLLWGCEAVAVAAEGRANPNQLMINEHTVGALSSMREEMVAQHELHFSNTDDLLVGLQLTHSGRFARPEPGAAHKPRTVYRDRVLDEKFSVDADKAILSDEEIEQIIQAYIDAAPLAEQAGFEFVDVKHCHGYLGHEFLSAVNRSGRFGGSFENRTRFLREIVEGIRTVAPKLKIGLRLSAFDCMPYKKGEDDIGVPYQLEEGESKYIFGPMGSPNNFDDTDLSEPIKFLHLVRELGIKLISVSAGSPYYNPHIQRPALYPPSDGYLPPEDPLVGVARQLAITARLKKEFPDLCIVGSGYSYLQELLPNVGQAVLAQNGADFVGLGRMVLSYPEMPADILRGKTLKRKKICRTFSDCTTAPRNGMISGCYPLDPYYKKMPEADELKALKKSMKLA